MDVIGDVEIVTDGKIEDRDVLTHVIVARVCRKFLLEFTDTLTVKQPSWFDDYDEYLRYCKGQGEKRKVFERKLLACFDVDVDDDRYSYNVKQNLTEVFTILVMEKTGGEAKT